MVVSAMYTLCMERPNENVVGKKAPRWSAKTYTEFYMVVSAKVVQVLARRVSSVQRLSGSGLPLCPARLSRTYTLLLPSLLFSRTSNYSFSMKTVW
jgi:hypothetical protein